MGKMESKLFKWLMVLSIIAYLGLPANAAEYPIRPIILVIPWPPGGSGDMIGRVLANAAAKYLGQPIIVENKSGGGGSVGPTLVLAKPPDGYTIGVMASASLAISWHMGKMEFNPIEDPTPVIRYTGALYGIVVRADSQWKTIQEFIRYSEQNPEKISYGTPGVGTGPHLAMESLASRGKNIQWIHVPFKGGAPAHVALLGNHVEAVSDSSGWAPLVDAGKLRLLATFGEKRSARYPQTPTLKEIGYDVVAQTPHEIFGPKGMPQPIVSRLHDAFKRAMNEPEFHAALSKLGFDLLYLNPEECKKVIREESVQMGEVVRQLGLQKK
jgi:tripartite-type tricarboxylate transporter receptor subunit TctC